MSDKPPQPPEAAAIQRAMVRSRLSARQAATKAGISEGRWRQIVSGYQSARGQHIPVVAPAATLAHMARAVDLAPSELAEAGRGDAAAVLRDLGRTRTPEPEVVEGDRNASYADEEDEALIRVMRSALPDAKKRQLVELLIAEREAADRLRAERAQQLIDLIGGSE